MAGRGNGCFWWRIRARALAGLACALCGGAWAAEPRAPDSYVHAYVAQWTLTRFTQVLQFDTDPQDSYLGSVAWGRTFTVLGDHSRLEWELQAVKHWGIQDHPEVAAAIAIRWHGFRWDPWLRNTFAFGTGLSYAFDVPPIEQRGDDESTYLLQQLLAEATFAPPGVGRWSLFLRVHHRSGAFGLVADSGSSNFVGWGVRHHF